MNTAVPQNYTISICTGVTSFDDLYSTGFFDYLETGAILAIEWSENIEDALPDRTIRVTFERLEEEKRRITLEGGGRF